jgi:acyl dehydratase
MDEAMITEGKCPDFSAQMKDFLTASREQLGCSAMDSGRGASIADWTTISRHVVATGDDNPLYTDFQHAAKSWWCGPLAPPGLVLSILVPESVGALYRKPYDAVELLSRIDLWWNDHIRLGESVDAHAVLTAVEPGPLVRDRATVDLTTRAVYCTRSQPVATATGVVRVHPLRLGEELIADRTIHSYTDAEIAHIEAGLAAEPTVRGPQPRWHSSVSVGDRLPSMVRGPVTWSELLSWIVAEGRCAPAGNLRYRQLLEEPGNMRAHGATNRQFSERNNAREDAMSCADVGFPAPGTRPAMIVALASQMLTRWIGDDAFLRHLSVSLDLPVFYGDTLFMGGQVSRKFIQVIDSKEYFAVSIEIWGHNQLEQRAFSGRAIVFLPENGHPIQLPVQKEFCS